MVEVLSMQLRCIKKNTINSESLLCISFRGEGYCPGQEMFLCYAAGAGTEVDATVYSDCYTRSAMLFAE